MSDTAKVIQVIYSEVHRGVGTTEDRCRIVKQYHAFDGTLLFEDDPCLSPPPNPQDGQKHYEGVKYDFKSAPSPRKTAEQMAEQSRMFAREIHSDKKVLLIADAVKVAESFARQEVEAEWPELRNRIDELNAAIAEDKKLIAHWKRCFDDMLDVEARLRRQLDEAKASPPITMASEIDVEGATKAYWAASTVSPTSYSVNTMGLRAAIEHELKRRWKEADADLCLAAEDRYESDPTLHPHGEDAAMDCYAAILSQLPTPEPSGAEKAT